MSTQAYNLLWLTPRFATPSEPFRQPIPAKTLENMIRIAQKNPAANVRLWVDSKRMSDSQMEWLRRIGRENSTSNLQLLDLRTIPEYDENYLFQQEDMSPNWRDNKHSAIWRQVDAAKLFVCLQGDYDQVFYSDTDTIIPVDSNEVQRRLVRHGLVVGGGLSDEGRAWFENQAFGFNRDRLNFFRILYYKTMEGMMRGPDNGYATFIDSMRKLMGSESNEVVMKFEHDGTYAHHPEGQVSGSESKG